ncbi:MAG: ABC transporter transmembrane domain-containing protein, partial [Dehalococcoidia bacterium]
MSEKRREPTLLRAYFSMESSSRKKVAWVILLSLGSALSQGLSVGLLLPVLEFVEKGGLPQDGGLQWRLLELVFRAVPVPLNLPSLLLAVLVMIALAQLLLYLQRAQTARLREEFAADLRRQAFGAFMKADIAYLQTTDRGSLVNGLTEEVNRAAIAIYSFVDFLARFMLVAMFAGLLLAISWQTSLAGLAVVALGSLLVQRQIRRSRKLGQEVVDYHNQLHGFVVERLEGAREVKLNAAEPREQSRFQKLADSLAGVMYHYAKSAAQIRLIMEPAVTGGGLLILYIGVAVFSISLAQLAVF